MNKKRSVWESALAPGPYILPIAFDYLRTPLGIFTDDQLFRFGVPCRRKAFLPRNTAEIMAAVNYAVRVGTFLTRGIRSTGSGGFPRGMRPLRHVLR